MNIQEVIVVRKIGEWIKNCTSVLNLSACKWLVFGGQKIVLVYFWFCIALTIFYQKMHTKWIFQFLKLYSLMVFCSLHTSVSFQPDMPCWSFFVLHTVRSLPAINDSFTQSWEFSQKNGHVSKYKHSFFTTFVGLPLLGRMHQYMFWLQKFFKPCLHFILH